MRELVSRKENIYFWLCILFSLIGFISLFAIITTDSDAVLIVFVYFVYFFIVISIGQRILLGKIMISGVKISKKQLPEIYKKIEYFSKEMELKKIPKVYLLESSSKINAFITKFIGKKFVVLYSDILEMAYEEGEDVVDFIICHELAHIKRKHATKNLFIFVMKFTVLGNAYSRACEYTCDAIATYLAPVGAQKGLLILASGKKLYKYINKDAFIDQIEEDKGLLRWSREINSSEPMLAKRVQRVNEVIEEFHINLNREKDKLFG